VVALVVILLPEVLDGEKTASKQEFVDIPAAPAAIVVEAPDKFPQQTLEDNAYIESEIVDELALDDTPEAIESELENSSAKAESAANDEEELAQVLDIQASTSSADATATQKIAEPEAEPEIEVKDSGWVIQLGSFRNEKNVNDLISTLKQAGYRAYSQPVQTKVGLLNKVFVGPELERARLEQALPHLQEITKLKGKITAFEVSAG